ncbi:hypothetical protein ACVGWR_03750, partial [Enterobacter hormaechei]
AELALLCRGGGSPIPADKNQKKTLAGLGRGTRAKIIKNPLPGGFLIVKKGYWDPKIVYKKNTPNHPGSVS